jgi:hypothetical protein
MTTDGRRPTLQGRPGTKESKQRLSDFAQLDERPFDIRSLPPHELVHMTARRLARSLDTHDRLDLGHAEPYPSGFEDEREQRQRLLGVKPVS